MIIISQQKHSSIFLKSQMTPACRPADAKWTEEIVVVVVLQGWSFNRNWIHWQGKVGVLLTGLYLGASWMTAYFCNSQVLFTALLGLILWFAAHPTLWHSNSQYLATVSRNRAVTGIRVEHLELCVRAHMHARTSVVHAAAGVHVTW